MGNALIKAALLSVSLLCGYVAPASASEDWSVLVPQVLPAAVHIDAYLQTPVHSGMWDIPGVRRTWFSNLFAKVHSWLNADAENGSFSEGAGYFYETRGMVLTAAHVVAGANQVWVTLADRRRLEAHIVAADTASDVAVLKINSGGSFPALAPAAPNSVRVGEPVLAIGSPVGFSHSVTTGIISAKREDNYFARDTFLQTDAPLTYGYSGGVIVDSKGRAVGISTYGHVDRAVSFLVPIDRALRVAAYLARGEHPPRACTAIFEPNKGKT